jgi:hypothetical protein
MIPTVQLISAEDHGYKLVNSQAHARHMIPTAQLISAEDHGYKRLHNSVSVGLLVIPPRIGRSFSH